MKLVVGLGNPGTKYTWTWHNLGFLVLDHFLSGQPSFSTYREKGKALLASVPLEGRTAWFMKPQTFMNLSGEALPDFVRSHGVEPEETIVVHDEVDLEEGRIQLKKGGGSAGHRGLESIFQYWSRDFYRLRVGAGKPKEIDTADHVLRKAPRERLEPIVARASADLAAILAQGPEKAISAINVWPRI